MKKQIILLVAIMLIGQICWAQNNVAAGKTEITEVKTDTTISIKINAVGTDENKSIVKQVETSTVTKAISKLSENCGCLGENDTRYEKVAWLLIAILVLGFVYFVIKKSILRDGVSDINLFETNARKMQRYTSMNLNEVPRSFSLAKSQLGFWTIIIASSYIYLSFQCCGQALEFNTTVLTLLGISLATSAIGGTIDKGQDDLERHQNEPSKGFLMDIISDEKGVSIHRFQNVVFTLVAMIIYIFKICRCGALPELDTTLLALTGASSATYLGMKAGENKNAPAKPISTPENKKDDAGSEDETNAVG